MNRPIAVALVAVCLLPVSAGGADEPSIFERTSTNLRAPETPAAAETAEASQRLGAAWLVSAQGADGGWGAGPAGQPGATHPSDVATTAYAVLALTRDALGSSRHLEARTKGITFVVKAIENAPEGPRLATPSGTQPQNKLGPLVDT
ncbi:MAG: hypothetical protein KTR31_41495, partial [Myxococcales bacterium]|nr:hypothetical protein [Myxococcales bacterium]